MSAPIVKDGWAKSSRSGSGSTECVEIKAIEEGEQA